MCQPDSNSVMKMNLFQLMTIMISTYGLAYYFKADNPYKYTVLSVPIVVGLNWIENVSPHWSKDVSVANLPYGLDDDDKIVQN